MSEAESPTRFLRRGTPQDMGRRVVSIVAGDHGGLTANYVKSSIDSLLIEDDHPVVTWGWV
jgi:hypothetical protein